ncbi:CMRF35-like molecule 8 [Peromyscus maniculatus bairdii]|uniref:CMRF35-like molecule 8 n=1 Tax=Peromyscus maniculatus bairdii TaxID=230844 RepID=UPI003FD63FBE
MTGTVGESLSVRCQYKEEHKNKKYWCRVSLLPACKEIVRTRASKEAGNGRVSIRDHPATLIFTVTLENLTLEDAGTCICGVDILLFDDSLRKFHPSLGIDDFFKVVVSVVPDKPSSCQGILSPGQSFPHERRKPDIIAWSHLVLSPSHVETEPSTSTPLSQMLLWPGPKWTLPFHGGQCGNDWARQTESHHSVSVPRRMEDKEAKGVTEARRDLAPSVLSLTLTLSSAGRLASSLKVPTSPSAPWEGLGREALTRTCLCFHP